MHLQADMARVQNDRLRDQGQCQENAYRAHDIWVTDIAQENSLSARNGQVSEDMDSNQTENGL